MKKETAFEKADAAKDKKAGIVEDSKADKKSDAKAVQPQGPKKPKFRPY